MNHRLLAAAVTLPTVVAIALILVSGVVSAQEGSAARTANDALAGEKLFGNMCGFCHQGGGRVAGRGPKLAGTDKPDQYLLNRIRVGKEGAMPAYARAFTEPQLRELLAYIRSLKDEAQ